MKKTLLLFIIIISVVACNSSKKEENKGKESAEQIVHVNQVPVKEVNPDNYREENIESEIAEEVIPDSTPEEVSEIEEVKNESKPVKEPETVVKEVIVKTEEKVDTETQVKPQPIIEKKVTKEVVEKQAESKKQEVVSVFDNQLWTTLLKKYVDSNGDVNYAAIKANKSELTAYLNQFTKTTPKSSWTKNEKLAYWINAYNAFTVKLIVDNYPLKSIKDIKSPWDKKFIPINGELISLSHIEHEILRKMNEPRIHFAINCASISCPKLLNVAFESNTMNSQLNKVSKGFVNNPEKNRLDKSEVKISKIFKWFNKDFEKKGTVIDFLNKFSNVKIDPKAKTGYLDYNWNLNKQ